MFTIFCGRRSLSSTLQPDRKEAYSISELCAHNVTEAKILSVLGNFNGKRLISFEPPVEEEPSALLAELNAAKEAFTRVFKHVEFTVDMSLTIPDGLYFRPENTALTATDFIRGCASETSITISEMKTKRIPKTSWLYIEVADSSIEILQRVWRLEVASIILARINKDLTPKAVIVLVAGSDAATFHSAVERLARLPQDLFVKKIPFYVGILDSDQSAMKTFLRDLKDSRMKDFQLLVHIIAEEYNSKFWLAFSILVILKVVFSF